MNKADSESKISLSDAGKLRREEILDKLKTQMSTRRVNRRRRQVLAGVVAMLALAAAVTWSVTQTDGGSRGSQLSQNENVDEKESAEEELAVASKFRPQVVTNRAGLTKSLVVTNVSYDRPRIEFDSIETEELNQLLEEQGGKFVVGRIGGKLRVVALDND